MLKRARRVLRQLSPHEHRWVRQHLGGGLEQNVCDRCGALRSSAVPAPASSRRQRPANSGISAKPRRASQNVRSTAVDTAQS